MSFEIKTLKDGEKITEPGFYAIPLEVHHNQPCDGPCVTSGVLRNLQIKTPADVWAYHALNPDRAEFKETDALREGQAMHYFVEGGKAVLDQHVYVLPADKPNKPTAAQIAKYEAGEGTPAGIKSIEFWAEVEAETRTIITQDQYDLIIAMGEVLAKDPAASAALGGMAEVSMAWKDEATDLWCLARPDQVQFTGMLSDYKKIATAGRGAFNGRLIDMKITSFRYDMQMAFAAEGFEALTGETPELIGIVAQSSEPPYSVILRPIGEEDIALAAFHIRQSRQVFADCLKTGNWWGPGQHIQDYQRPEWQREQILNEMQIAGEAP